MKATRDLTVREHMVLDVAGKRWRYQGTQETYVREHLGMSLTRYHQVLNALLDKPAALQAYPQLVRRLQRLREQRVRARRSRLAS